MISTEQVQVEHLVRRLGGYPDYPTALGQLNSIMLAYENEMDELSDDLFNWCEEVLTHVEEHPGEGVPAIHAFAQEKLRELRYQILINDYDVTNPDPRMTKTLVCPMIDREWIWEKKVLDLYLALSPLSPFDEQPIQARAHNFALAMLDWSEDLYVNPGKKLGTEHDREIIPAGFQATPILKNPFMNQIKLRLYQEVAKNILTQKKLKNIRRNNAQELAIMRRELQDISAAEVRRAQRCAQEAVDIITNNIKGLKLAHQQEVKALQDIQNIVETKIEAQERQLSVQQNLIHQLGQKLTHMERVRAEQNQKLADAQRRSNKRKRGIHIRV